MIFVGIDCGMDGGIAAVGSSGNVLRTAIMPTMKAGKGRVLDMETFQAILMHPIDGAKEVTYIIEDPGGHAPSAAGLRSMTYSFAVADCITFFLHQRRLIVRAQEWQGEFWKKPKVAKGEKFNTKAAALLAAVRLFPNEDLRKSSLAKNAHDGIVDALLIAEYGRRKLR